MRSFSTRSRLCRRWLKARPPLSSTHKISFAIEFSLHRVSDALLTGATLYVVSCRNTPAVRYTSTAPSVSLGVALCDAAASTTTPDGRRNTVRLRIRCRIFLGIAAVQTGIPQAVACTDEHAALCFGERVAAALVGGYAGCNTGQQRQAFVRSSKDPPACRSVGFAVRLQQKSCRMSLRCDSTNQIIVPIWRYPSAGRIACASCQIQNSRRVFSFGRAP